MAEVSTYLLTIEVYRTWPAKGRLGLPMVVVGQSKMRILCNVGWSSTILMDGGAIVTFGLRRIPTEAPIARDSR